MKVSSGNDLKKVASKLLESLGPAHAATIIALSGDLGAGKTTFVQALAEALGVQESVTSPTFIIEKVYDLPAQAGLEGQKFSRLVHVDAYRLKSAHELEVLGWKELIEDPGNLIVIEWPERVEEFIPFGAERLRFDIKGEERIITIDGKTIE